NKYKGYDGTSSGAPYKWSSNTTIEYPDAGTVRFNNADIGTVNAISVSYETAKGGDVEAWTDLWGSSTSPFKSLVTITKTDGSAMAIFVVGYSSTYDTGWKSFSVWCV